MIAQIISFPVRRVDRGTDHLAMLEQTRPDLSDAEREERAAYLDELLKQCWQETRELRLQARKS